MTTLTHPTTGATFSFPYLIWAINRDGSRSYVGFRASSEAAMTVGRKAAKREGVARVEIGIDREAFLNTVSEWGLDAADFNIPMTISIPSPVPASTTENDMTPADKTPYVIRVFGENDRYISAETRKSELGAKRRAFELSKLDGIVRVEIKQGDRIIPYDTSKYPEAATRTLVGGRFLRPAPVQPKEPYLYDLVVIYDGLPTLRKRVLNRESAGQAFVKWVDAADMVHLRDKVQTAYLEERATGNIVHFYENVRKPAVGTMTKAIDEAVEMSKAPTWVFLTEDADSKVEVHDVGDGFLNADAAWRMLKSWAPQYDMVSMFYGGERLSTLYGEGYHDDGKRMEHHTPWNAMDRWREARTIKKMVMNPGAGRWDWDMAHYYCLSERLGMGNYKEVAEMLEEDFALMGEEGRVVTENGVKGATYRFKRLKAIGKYDHREGKQLCAEREAAHRIALGRKA